jgi:hypothetical protein
MQGNIDQRPSTFSRSQTVIIGAVVVLTLIVIGLVLGSNDNDSSRRAPAPVAVPLVVHYEVEGDGASSASLTLQTPTGTSQQTADLPVKNKSGGEGLIFSGFSRGDFLYVSAQNQDEYGSVTCRIKVGDTVVSENTSSGAYQIATCQAQA